MIHSWHDGLKTLTGNTSVGKPIFNTIIPIIRVTKTTRIVVGAMAFEDNIYDGHAIEPQLA